MVEFWIYISFFICKLTFVKELHCQVYGLQTNQKQQFIIITMYCSYLLLCVCIQVVSQTVSVVDLSCYSLETVPEYLFYCQDITHLNLRHNFMNLQGPGGLLNLPRWHEWSPYTVKLWDFFITWQHLIAITWAYAPNVLINWHP